MAKFNPAQDTDMLTGDLDLCRAVLAGFAAGIATAKIISPFAANCLNIDVLAALCNEEPHSRLINIGIESPCKAFISGDYDQERGLFFAAQQQWMANFSGLGAIGIDALYQRLQDIREHLLIGTRS